MSQTILLRVFKNAELVQVKQFNKEQIVIGRNADVDLVIDSDKVAPIHALVEKRESSYYLCDLGSEFGVMMAGQKVLDSPLKHDDSFELGPFTLQFFEGIPKPKAAPGASPNGASAPNGQSAKASPAAPPPPKVKEAPPAPKAEVAPEPPREVAQTVATTTKVGRTQTHSAPSVGTFAKPSTFKDASEILTPTTGNVVEVMLVWRERVLHTYHFHEKQVITAGYDPSCMIFIPRVHENLKAIPLLNLEGQVAILLFPGFSGEVFNAQKTAKNFEQLQKEGRVSQGADGRSFFLQQKELVKLNVPNSELALFIRFVPDTAKPSLMPWFDLTPSEFTGLVLSLVVTAIVALYTTIYSPPVEEKPEEQEMEKVATFVYKSQPKPVEIAEQAKPQVAPVEEKKKESTKATQKKDDSKAKPGQIAEVAPKKEDKKLPPAVTSVKPIASKKVGRSTNPGGAVSEKPKPQEVDVSKLGLFASSGLQKSLEGAKDTGTLTAVGSAAAQEAGEKGPKSGAGMNVPKTKAGPGGSGVAPIGIAGVGVNVGSGLGRSGGPGLGSGLTKGNVTVNAGGEGESFTGSMDREAIRRVVRENLNELRTCYERQLQSDPNLSGKLVLQWEIREGGVVGKVDAVNRGDTIKNQRVIDCCRKVLKNWRFPEPPPNMVGLVSYPFVFQSQ